MVYLMLFLGLTVLTVGAELLVRGASRLAVSVGISPLVVGLTVVAFGTSAPELVVSLQSAYLGQPDVALGNVLGSNIFNVLFILGISAIIVPLTVSQQLIRFDVPLMVALSILVGIMGFDGKIGVVDGAFLATVVVAYTTFAIIKSRKEEAAIKAEYAAEFGNSEGDANSGNNSHSSFANAFLVIAGLALLVLGAHWFVDSAVAIARNLQVSELVIGVTIVAAGTSLPEVATSIMAAIRGEKDIAVGNVVGSNIFNIMGVLGISSVASGTGIAVAEQALRLDVPVMIAVAVACLPVFFTGHRIARWEGAMFFGYYIAYTCYLLLAIKAPEATGTYGMVVLGMILPLTVITLLVGVVRYYRQFAATA
ncbi:MAG TPA: sodium:calcium antiporter [Planctomycetaceae bacterium]|nr:sodium:calcium antiporter [Planctomycetaceae bacterium]